MAEINGCGGFVLNCVLGCGGCGGCGGGYWLCLMSREYHFNV